MSEVRFIEMIRAKCGKWTMAAALSAGLLGLTGCSYTNPQQTTHQYSASDGTHAEVGPAQLRNMLIVASDENQPGRVLGAIYNSSSDDIRVTLSGAEGAQAQVPVVKNSYTLLNDSTDPVTLSTAGGKPGSLVDVKVTVDGTNMNQTFKVPVLDDTLPEYAPYLPGWSPTPTPSLTDASTAVRRADHTVEVHLVNEMQINPAVGTIEARAAGQQPVGVSYSAGSLEEANGEQPTNFPVCSTASWANWTGIKGTSRWEGLEHLNAPPQPSPMNWYQTR